MSTTPSITISIVSHRQAALVEGLLEGIARCCQAEAIDIVLTLNLPEEPPAAVQGYPCPVRVIRNAAPQGFGANHNQAFRQARGDYFCVLNPDVRLTEDAFRALVRVFEADPGIGLAAPQVVNAQGGIEDSARRFPRMTEILGKAVGGNSRVHADDGQTLAQPDWVAGMFMMLPAKVFRELGGFDAHYFLYYEDVDLCARLRLAGYRVALCRQVSVVHDARRSSHRSLRYARLHLSSMARFFLSPVYRKLRRGGLLR